MTNAYSTHGVPASTRGVVFVHACPPAIAPHVEWALAGVLGVPPRMEWTAQPADPLSISRCPASIDVSWKRDSTLVMYLHFALQSVAPVVEVARRVE